MEFLRGFLPFALLLAPYILFSTERALSWFRDFISGSFPRKLLLPVYLLLIYAVFSFWDHRFDGTLLLKLSLWTILPALLFSFDILNDHPLYPKEFAAALLLWLPIELGQLPGFDIKFSEGIQIPALAFAAPVLGLYLFAVLRNLPDIGYNFRWRLSDLKPVALSLLVLACLLIPLGVHSGFIRFSSFDTPPAKMVELVFGIYFLNALPEELLFRGIIQNLFAKVFAEFSQAKWIALILASAIFGLSHYNNFNPPDWRYVYLAALAGLFYGWTYIKTGKTSVSALVHTGVNVLWAVLFKDTGG